MSYHHLRNIRSGTPKMKKDRPWVGLEIRNWGLASHPRAHARAQYGLVLANYAMPDVVSHVMYPKSHRTPELIALFVKFFPKYLPYPNFDKCSSY